MDILSKRRNLLGYIESGKKMKNKFLPEDLNENDMLLRKIHNTLYVEFRIKCHLKTV